MVTIRGPVPCAVEGVHVRGEAREVYAVYGLAIKDIVNQRHSVSARNVRLRLRLIRLILGRGKELTFTLKKRGPPLGDMRLTSHLKKFDSTTGL